jgi:1,2-diacylglycerol 3-alpha-glucosyltransferase
MKICMMTNTYLPHVGGVARSVSTFVNEYQRLGHEVLVVAPHLPGRMSKKAESVVERVAAIQNFNGTDFSIRLPLAATMSARLEAFEANLVHAHHPFLLGDTALRIATNRSVPVIFTHHTKYEDYVHYLPFASPALKRAAIQMSTEFANLCDGVIAPSASIASLIRRRGVKVPIRVVPTGVDTKGFAQGDGAKARQRYRIAPSAFVVGHVGRLAPEKNLRFLAEAVALFLKHTPAARFLVVGAGPADADIKQVFEKRGLSDRLIMTGSLTGRNLHDAYKSMNVFAFTSKSETQGLVIAEAMSAGLPVVAVRASGVREVVRPGENGIMVPPNASTAIFARQLERLAGNAKQLQSFQRAALATAAGFSREECAKQALDFYEEIRKATRRERRLTAQSSWLTLQERISVEWDLLSRNARALSTALAS